MALWVGVDDTDMPGTKGTGWLLEDILKRLSADGMGTYAPISRHQLFVHETVPYTSHNSSMCTRVTLSSSWNEERLADCLAGELEDRSQPGSDPGLCICGRPEEQALDRLIRFGRAVKERLATKDEAYALAQDLDIRLTEHGGTGDGVIGALAGVGLRMSGNDGRYRGWLHLGNPGDILPARTLHSHSAIDRLILGTGQSLDPGASVCISSERTKTVRQGHARVLVVKETPEMPVPGFRTLTKKEAKAY